MKKIPIYVWTLEIAVQGLNEDEARQFIKDRLEAFVLRGASVEEGTIRQIAEDNP